MLFLSCTQGTSSTITDPKTQQIGNEEVLPVQNNMQQEDAANNTSIQQPKTSYPSSEITSNDVKNDKEEALRWAQEMFHNSSFLPLELAPPELKEKDVALAKDFAISQQDGGLENFRKGNINFLGYAKHKTAISHYKAAIQKGLKNKEIRQECYINLAVCLYQDKQIQKAQQLVRYAWLISPQLEIDAGEQATRDALQQHIANLNKMPK